jgi:protein O-GlcNAc transferase
MSRKHRRAAAKLSPTQVAGTTTPIGSAVSELWAAGVQHHQAGRLDEAEACYRRVLAAQPDNAEAYSNLGAALKGQRKLDAAVAAYRQAIGIKPHYFRAYFNLGNALKEQRKLEEAIAAYRRAIGLKPDYIRAHFNLANALKDQGKLDEAVVAYRRAIGFHSDDAEAHYSLGNALKEQGKLDLAIASYRRAIGIKPDYAEIHCDLGNTLRDQAKLDEAVAAYRRAIAIKPDYAQGYSNLGVTLAQQGKLDEAVAAYRQAVGLAPDLAATYSNLGNALKDQGRLEEAIAAYRKAVSIKPDLAEAHSNLGNALRDQGKPDEAVLAYREAIGIKPDYAEAYSNLGVALVDQGKLDDAVAAYRQAVGVEPDLAAAYSNLGNALKDQGKLEEAIAAYRKAVSIKPDLAEAHSNLGNALRDQGRLDEAVLACRQAIGNRPDYAEAHCNLGNALRDQAKLDEAVLAYRQAIRIKPDYAEAHSNLGAALVDQGKHDEAIAAFRQATEIKPDLAEAYSNLLLCLNYDDKWTAEHLFAAHREWDKRYGRQISRPTAYANDREVGRRLKIGYVSPDFRTHSVAHFVEPLLKEHDRQAVEVFCYAEVKRPDTVTTDLQGLADHWLATVGLSDDELAERIRADGIDILIDLAGHTAGNRLRVFARKPAPVQVTWLGYPNTTGLAAIDYRLVDAVTDPAGEANAWTSETLVRLEDGFLCYGARKDAPEPAVPSSLKIVTVTFGSFNNPAKLSAATLDVWATLLSRLPEARLLLKGEPFADAATRAFLLARLVERGVAAERIELVAWLPDAAAHLALYHRMDIALDPFPYNGTTTTCEALWMGVPVVTLRGDRHAGRVGASLLSQIGLTDLIADSVEEYVEIAVALAGNTGRLSDLRRVLRQRMAASPLCDGPAFARKLESAFRTTWQRWCERFQIMTP